MEDSLKPWKHSLWRRTRKYEYPKQAPPTFYQVTNNAKERPDVWVESPEKTHFLLFQVFAAPYSLRFPRIDKVRYDKPWHECLDVQSELFVIPVSAFVDLVHSTNGTTQREDNYGVEQGDESKSIRSSRKREKKNVSAVPSHFVLTDVSRIKGETSMFSDMVFYFANVPSSHTLQSLHKMVVEHGGAFSMNLNKSVTHCIAAESRGIKFQAAKLHGDVIQCSWLVDCCLQKKLLPLQPKYFVFLSDSTKKKMEAEVDEYSDSFYSDISIEEIKLLLRNIEHSEDSKTVEYYKKKYCPKDEWARFHGCYIYFFIPKQCLDYSDCKVLVELAMRRMNVEISVGGGKVGDNLFHATHVVVMSLPEIDVKFNEVLYSFSEAEKHVLYNTKLHVVGARWLEDSFKEDQKLLEESYSLKPSNFQMSISEKSRHDKLKGDSEKCKRPSSPDKHGGQIKAEGISDQGRAITLPKRGRKRDRGRPTGSATAKGKVGINVPRRVKRKVTSSCAKIHGNESDESATSGEHLRNDESEAAVGSHETIAVRSSGIQNEDDVQDLELSPDDRKTLPPGTAECSVISERLDEAHKPSYGSGNIVWGKDKVDELEDPVDPVQAMLLHMIPHLDSKPTRSVDPLVKDDKPEADTNPSPKKKKKVSYKDVAGELLKDW
ncbi:hypothetical protein H5410_035979 [Solanum commersonii]|uniref:BRCT domain-containing protein n=1 Tax=Solanum commersonii TaxID=4109 RepID=A0A9J5Y291_SOLCO|nr:hypothetical protein H5410_035979 [Solanum commersonii]